MGPIDEKWLIDLLLMAPPLLFSLTLHEFAHARTALAFGDPTAKLMGRVTLNPLAHLDLIGTICLLFSNMIGWAKPVPVNTLNLRPRRLGDIMVSLAGPLSNLGLAVVACLLLRGAFRFQWDTTSEQLIIRLLWYTTVANIGLFVFNLIPLFPLDGHHIIRELLPPGSQAGFMNWQARYGQFLLLGMIFIPRMLQISGQPVKSPLRVIMDPLTSWAVGFALGS